MRPSVGLLALVAALGCKGPSRGGSGALDISAVSAESAVMSFKNEAKHTLGVMVYIWTNGGDRLASGVRKLAPGEAASWAPFSEIRTFISKNPLPADEKWLQDARPSTDYSLAIVRVGEDDKTANLALERFTYNDLQDVAVRPIRVVLHDDSAEFFRGDKSVKSQFAR